MDTLSAGSGLTVWEVRLGARGRHPILTTSCVDDAAVVIIFEVSAQTLRREVVGAVLGSFSAIKRIVDMHAAENSRLGEFIL